MRLRNWAGLFTGLGIFGFALGLGLSLAPQKKLAELSQAVGFGEPSAHAQLPSTSSAPPQAARPTNSNRHTVIVDVAQAVSPAVVSIGVTKNTTVKQYDPFGDFFFPQYIIQQRKDNFPYLGSGFIIDKQGHIVTNYHVIADALAIYVTLTDKRTFQARLLDADRHFDVALLQIQDLKGDENLPALALGDSSDIMIGETVLAVGNPFGPLIADPRPSVSSGVVSAVNRTFNDMQNNRLYQDMIQTDAAINPGNSGGPLVNLDKQVIGMNTFIFSTSGESASVGFSIPINRVQRVVREILQYGHVRTARVDFDYVTVTPFLVKAIPLAVNSGAMVHSFEEGGPADRAGLRPGDVITAVNGKEIKAAEELFSALLTHNVGDELKLSVIRQNSRLNISYALQEARDNR